ncbi:MAG: xanthine dehydrogenase family protein molybdopterin-binding subunit [Microbacteriaceae bacterium]|nr:xanthine dehydrogenase family protein molybdopterin-binding subunit [Burkholderiaceae bacterium]
MNNIDRRTFLISSGALVVGFSSAGSAAAAAAPVLDPAKAVDKARIESFVAIQGDGRATIYTGKVDLGNGSRTAMAQLAADELDLPFDRITMVMGDTATTPDQWLTGASTTIAQGGMELRRACATARAVLLARGAAKLGLAPEDAACRDGAVFAKADPVRRVGYGDLAVSAPLQLAVDPKVLLKKPADYQWIGKPIPRVDIPGKLTGEWTYVHDFRVPGMLHARVLRPGAVGASLLAFDDSAAKQVDGFVRSVRKGDFLAVLAQTEWGAIKAMRATKAQWGGAEQLPEQATVFDHWRTLKVAKEDVTQNVGDARAALAAAPRTLKARYDFAVQTHASMGPSCAVADFHDGQLTVWSASQATHSLVTEIAPIVGLPAEKVRIVYLEGSGCYGRNGHEDASADAALLAVLTGKPVRVQWMRDDEMARSPKSPPRSIDLEAGLDERGDIVAWQGDFWIALNHIVAFKPLDFPLLAAAETGVPRAGNWVGFLFQSSGIGYTLPNVRVNTRHVEKAFFRSAHLRSPGRIENTFANESFIDELAYAAKADPAEYRLRVMKDPRGVAVIQKAMARAKWQPRVGVNPTATAGGEIARGRGISYLRYSNNNTYVAAVADVAVNRKTGEIKVERVCIAHDCGLVVNPDGTINQIEGGTIQTVSRTLMEAVRWDRREVLSRDWLSYPILRHDQVPRVEVDLIDRPDQPTFAVGEPTPCAIPAAIANAVFDATGARLREVPFTPDRVKAALLRPMAT